MDNLNSKAKAMGAYLKSRRERLSPEDVGLSFSNGPRKTPGLRREEVSILAGVSVTYYTWLEQGREVNASRDVIASIAKALRLSPDEESHLFQLWSPHPPNGLLTTPTVLFPQMQKIIDQIAYPSYITNERTEILAWNKSANEMLADFASIPARVRYFIRLFFENKEIRDRIVNIEDFSNYSVAVFRTYYDKHQDDPWFRETVERLVKSSAEFEQMWKLYDIQVKKVNRVFVRVPGRNTPIAFDINSLANLSDSPDIHICIYTPVTEDWI